MDCDSADYLTSLPLDLQQKLFVEYIGPRDTTKLRSLSYDMLSVCSNDLIWRGFCCLELAVKPKNLKDGCRYTFQTEGDQTPDYSFCEVGSTLVTGSPMNYYDIYTRLLYPFRSLFNRLLTSDTFVYGELLTLTYDAGLVRGELWFAPSNSTGLMKCVLDFTVFVDEATNQLMILNEFGHPYVTVCAESFGSAWLNDLVVRGGGETFNSCGKREKQKVRLKFRTRFSHWLTRKKLLAYVVNDDLSWPQSNRMNQWPFPFLDQRVQLRMDTFFDIGLNGMQSREAVLFSLLPELPAPGASSRSLTLTLPQGFFKGAYGFHGTEIIQVWLRTESSAQLPTLVGSKLTGDPNVPAGKISFEFSLASAVIVQADQQNDVDFLEGLALTGPFVSHLTALRQPFRVPVGFHICEPVQADQIPKECEARFTGQGIIAGHGHTDPQSTVTHLVIFSADRFMVVWLHFLMHSATMFEKVSKEDKLSAYL